MYLSAYCSRCSSIVRGSLVFSRSIVRLAFFSASIVVRRRSVVGEGIVLDSRVVGVLSCWMMLEMVSRGSSCARRRSGQVVEVFACFVSSRTLIWKFEYKLTISSRASRKRWDGDRQQTELSGPIKERRKSMVSPDILYECTDGDLIAWRIKQDFLIR